MTTVLGIDPGKTGASALIETGCKPAIERRAKMTSVEWAKSLRNDAALACLVAIERTASSPQMGVKSAHTFGEERGLILAACYLSETRIIEVTPAKWQRAIGVHAIKGESQTDHKRRLKQRAQELFPSVTITNDVADALLIAHYAMTVELPKHRGKAV